MEKQFKTKDGMCFRLNYCTKYKKLHAQHAKVPCTAHTRDDQSSTNLKTSQKYNFTQ